MVNGNVAEAVAIQIVQQKRKEYNKRNRAAIEARDPGHFARLQKAYRERQKARLAAEGNANGKEKPTKPLRQK